MVFFSVFCFILFFLFLDQINLLFMLLLLVLTFVFLGGEMFSGFFFFDSFSFSLVFLSLLIFIYCFFSSLWDYWFSNFFGSFSLVLGSMFFLLLISFSCFSFLFFYFSFEFLFLLMFFFVFNWGYSPERLQASFYMIFYTLVVSLPFLIHIVVMGDMSLSIFGLYLSVDFYWWGFFLLVFLVKLPVYGAHLWLPKAHVEAPVSGSMLLAGVLLKLGGYGLVRFGGMFLSKIFCLGGYLVSLGLLGGLMSCFLCLRQVDLKSFVAYSSVCHMGFALSGFMIGSFLGYGGGLLMLISHGFCSSCLFYILFVLYERFYSRSMLILKGLGGILPLIGGIWFFFVVVNMGVPPFFPFFSEIMLFSSLVGKSWLTFFWGGFMLFFAGLYCVFLFILCFHGKSVSVVSLNLVTLRECLNFYSHFFYLFFSLIFFFFMFI